MRRTAVLIGVVLGLAGCGGSSSTKTVTTTVTTHAAATAPAASAQRPSAALLKHLCPPGNAYMGCSVIPAPRTTLLPGSSTQPFKPTVGTPMFPDVSSWQGFVNWPAVAAWQRAHGWPTGGIWKMGEYSTDPYASTNSANTRHLTWRSGYWFARNIGCQNQANKIIAAARAYGLKIVWIDAEVPEARGYGLCLSPLIRKAGLIAGEYTAPGTNPGGLDTSDPLWEATYGSSFSPIWRPVVAWQCTDGVYGCVTNVPGIGRDDVSIDLGISKLTGPPTPKPKPVRCFGAKRHHGPACGPPRAWEKRYAGAIVSTRHALTRNHCWVKNAKTPLCVKLRRRGDWFHGRQDRLHVAQLPYPAPWNKNPPKS